MGTDVSYRLSLVGDSEEFSCICIQTKHLDWYFVMAINYFLTFFRKKKAIIDPSLFKYKVQPVKKELYESVIVKASQLR